MSSFFFQFHFLAFCFYHSRQCSQQQVRALDCSNATFVVLVFVVVRLLSEKKTNRKRRKRCQQCNGVVSCILVERTRFIHHMENVYRSIRKQQEYNIVPLCCTCCSTFGCFVCAFFFLSHKRTVNTLNKVYSITNALCLLRDYLFRSYSRIHTRNEFQDSYFELKEVSRCHSNSEKNAFFFFVSSFSPFCFFL